MIDAVLVEVPNPRHPFGVRGVGEVPIIPPMAAIGNAIRDAIGMRMATCRCRRRRSRAALRRGDGWASARTRVSAAIVLSRARRSAAGSPAARRSSRWRRPPSGAWSWSWTSAFPVWEAGRGGDGGGIDGEIFQDAYAAQLRPDSEICLIPKIAGG